MCGIIAGLGREDIAPALVAGLSRLEYRGYDSAGIATLNDGALGRRRAAGPLANLEACLRDTPLSGSVGIGHTRWATHGAATEDNAHPHAAGRVMVVHNGIIENASALRAKLEAGGAVFHSETDTEVIAHLCDRHLRSGSDPDRAVELTVQELDGAFALVFLFEGEENLLIAARRGSPLAIGHGDGEMFVGSDAIALAPLTNRITYLEDGDRARVTRTGLEITTGARRVVTRPCQTVAVSEMSSEKGGHAHFMSKEIAEQPDRIAALAEASKACPALPHVFDGMDRAVIVGCGTARIAGLSARRWIETLAGLPVSVHVASEFRYEDVPLDARTAAIFISQSGETADTLAALRHVRGAVGRVISVVNVETSSLARESDVVVPIRAGAEIGVASTKAFTCQLVAFLELALVAGRKRGRLSEAELARHRAGLGALPGLLTSALSRDMTIAEIAREIAPARSALFLGRGAMHPIALEAALKLKEISYIHAEGYAAGELKHGPIALVDREIPVVVFAPYDALYEKTMSNVREVMARDGRVVLITDPEGARRAGDVWRKVIMPDAPELLSPVLYAIPAQLLAYHASVAKGLNVDRPRNLAKSVTVE
jgi:glucosamine--fructose-6-phosphate aminotransferase (isomerizing)